VSTPLYLPGKYSTEWNFRTAVVNPGEETVVETPRGMALTVTNVSLGPDAEGGSSTLEMVHRTPIDDGKDKGTEYHENMSTVVTLTMDKVSWYSFGFWSRQYLVAGGASCH
jgi:hypothetical protein